MPAAISRGDAEPGGRAPVLDVRLDHGALGILLQVRELREHELAGPSASEVTIAARDGTAG